MLSKCHVLFLLHTELVVPASKRQEAQPENLVLPKLHPSHKTPSSSKWESPIFQASFYGLEIRLACVVGSPCSHTIIFLKYFLDHPPILITIKIHLPPSTSKNHSPGRERGFQNHITQKHHWGWWSSVCPEIPQTSKARFITQATSTPRLSLISVPKQWSCDKPQQVGSGSLMPFLFIVEKANLNHNYSTWDPGSKAECK